MGYDTKCTICGDLFISGVKTAKFCSEECRRIDTRDKGRIRYGTIELQRTCSSCGINFKTWTKNQVYCSRKCSLKKFKEDNTKRNILSLRFRILHRDKFKCQYCGRTPQENGVILHVDHIKPKSKGGGDIKENLVTSCEDCNVGKFTEHFGEILTYFKNKDFSLTPIDSPTEHQTAD